MTGLQHWYMDPGWLALGLSFFTILLTVYWIGVVKRGNRVTVEERLSAAQVVINEFSATHHVRGPYATKLEVPDAELDSYTAKAVLFFHHIMILSLVFKNRDVLGPVAVRAYEAWANEIVGPWVSSDRRIKETWKLFRESKDLVGKETVEWLESMLPIT